MVYLVVVLAYVSILLGISVYKKPPGTIGGGIAVLMR
jgi:hypothetical protein